MMNSSEKSVCGNDFFNVIYAVCGATERFICCYEVKYVLLHFTICLLKSVFKQKHQKLFVFVFLIQFLFSFVSFA